MSTQRRFHRLVPALLVASLGGCLPFAQNEGDYEILPVEVFRDECGLLEANRDRFFGKLQITGRVVRMDFGLLDSQLIGFFLAEGEDFTLDGSVVNATAVVRGQECLLDQVNIHIDAATQCETQFDGVLRVRYESERQAACACELWMRYEAVQNGERCEG